LARIKYKNTADKSIARIAKKSKVYDNKYEYCKKTIYCMEKINLTNSYPIKENVKQSNHFPSEKEAEKYLEVTNEHADEKSFLITDALDKNLLPGVENIKKDKKNIRILEIGPGGGSTLEIWRDYAKQHVNTEIDVDAIEFINKQERHSESGKKHLKALKQNAIISIGQAQELPFNDNSFSAINISSVFHEVGSYDGGRKSINQALQEISRVLAPEGAVGYRDVAAPSENLNTPHQTKYIRPAWRNFIKEAAPYLIENSPDFYKNKLQDVKIWQKGKKISPRDINSDEELIVEAPIGFICEIQRHYITARDHLLRHGDLGLYITKTQWVNMEEGIKQTFIKTHLNSFAEEIAGEYSSGVLGDNEYIFDDGLDFDNMTDEVMQKFFKNIKKDDKKGKASFNEWLNREGHEFYFYYNISELIQAAVKASQKNNDQHVLMPKNSEDIQTIPRYYYQRYLNDVFDNPLPDAKQLVRFWKIPKQNAKHCLEKLVENKKLNDAMGESSKKCWKSINDLLN